MPRTVRLNTLHNVKVNDEAFFYIQRILIGKLEAGDNANVNSVASALILAHKHKKEAKNG